MIIFYLQRYNYKTKFIVSESDEFKIIYATSQEMIKVNHLQSSQSKCQEKN